MNTFDVEFARRHFPAFEEPDLAGWAFFENAGGSYACRQTIAELESYYRQTKVQPYGPYPASAMAGEAMDRAQRRWSEALGADPGEVHFGPSTSMNTYVLACAIGQLLRPGDEVVVTNQDHEANTGAIRRAAAASGATLVEWAVDATSGQLDPERLGAKLTSRTRFVTFPHASNIVGEENDVALLTAMAHEAGARVIVDGVSYAPHTIPNVAALNPDVYLFSLYKTYSVHQGVMVVRNGLIDELPNQGHYFNADIPGKRLTPAGPDHAQIAAAGAVLDYVELLDRHHDGGGGLREATDRVGELWRTHERQLLGRLLEDLATRPGVRVIGSTDTTLEGDRHRCPTVAFVVAGRDSRQVATDLAAHRVMAGSGHFYARRLIEAVGVDADSGVVRVSFVHYTSAADLDQLLSALDAIL